jgi:hypothetical protein
LKGRLNIEVTGASSLLETSGLREWQCASNLDVRACTIVLFSSIAPGLKPGVIDGLAKESPSVLSDLCLDTENLKKMFGDSKPRKLQRPRWQRRFVALQDSLQSR